MAYAGDTTASWGGINFRVLAAVIVGAKAFADCEELVGFKVEDWLPEDRDPNFREFHAAEMFSRNGGLSNLKPGDPLAIAYFFQVAMHEMDAHVVYGAVESNEFTAGLYPIDEKELAFRLCLLGAEAWLRKQGEELAILIHGATNDARYRVSIQEYFRKHRRRISRCGDIRGVLAHMHDDIYFGDSRFSVGIQLADFCAHLIGRHLCAPEGDTESLFQDLSPMIVSGRVEPSIELPEVF